MPRTQSYFFFGLADSSLCLFDLRRSLSDTKFQLDVVQTHEHLATLHVAADVHANGDHLAGSLRRHVSLLVTRKTAGSFKEARQITFDGRGSRHLDGDWLRVYRRFVFSRIGFRATTRRDENSGSDEQHHQKHKF